jgi:DtxR family Mn-dependent transcriptional regulator
MSVPLEGRALITPQAEDYLKTIYALSHGGKVTTQGLADELAIAPASVTGMLKRLAELHLITYVPYHGAKLTETGEKVALEVVRHHRLLELYLTRALGYTWDEVHDEADRLEHVISETFEARMAAVLGDPSYDPHGQPIPRLDGTVPDAGGQPLSHCAPGSEVRVLRVGDEDGVFLRYLTGVGLEPGARAVVSALDVLGGTVTLLVRGESRVLGLNAAERLWVQHL